MKYIKSTRWKEYVRENNQIQLDERIDPVVYVLYKIFFKDVIDFIAITEGRVFQTQLSDYLKTTQDLTTRQAETIINQLVYYKLVRIKKAGTNNANLVELTERISPMFFSKLYQANITRLRKNTLKAEYFIKKGDLEFAQIFLEKIDEEFIYLMSEHSIYFLLADRKSDDVLHFYFDMLVYQPFKGDELNEIIVKLKQQMRKLDTPFQLELRLIFQNTETLIEVERNYKKMPFKEIKDIPFENVETERFFSYGKYSNKPLSEKYKVVKSYEMEVNVKVDDSEAEEDDLI